jgi:DNA-binding NarL/FixJ family response regulator
MLPTIRVLIVHDDQLRRQCLAISLNATGHYIAADFAIDESQALQRLLEQAHDVVLLDWALAPEKVLRTTWRISQEFPRTKVLILSLLESAQNIRHCVEAGAFGYILRHESFDDLVTRINQAVRGEASCTPGEMRNLFSRMAELGEHHNQKERDPCILTTREMQILSLIADNMSNKQIAKQLNLSLHTVKNHVHNLLEKLRSPGRYAAVQHAYQRKWLQR